ncbi:DUF6194 family protein [Cellulomonas aerilata]|uniref:DUF6194 domain-containing protein n=1 Tax=Cellulomonas aerilata TaxID=515326 RepID=A0A512DBH4_9CELL|nr:DUF6194 family protein [Cellulomonas aerilata]GEO33832.1 hypothetical protein CAE01nite_15570 [Cellulomonas aerilata]
MDPLGPADLSDATALLRAIERGLPGIVSTTDSGDWYVFYDPDGVTVPESRFPFCTLMTGDRYDAASDLDRDPRTYRVNVGVTRATYEALLGPAPREPAGMQVLDTGADYTATDTVLPHPFYAPLHWVCVVDPGERTAAELGRLLQEAHGQAARRYRRRDR